MKWFTLLFSAIFVVAIFTVLTTGVSKISSSSSESINKLDFPQATLSAVSLNTEESAIIEEINRLRVSSRLSPLSSNSKTQDVALLRMTDMQTNQYYSHTSPGGVELKNLIPNSSGFACENLLLTESENPTTIVDEWMQSPSHRECILSEKITNAGISFGKFDESSNSDISIQLVTFIGAQQQK